MVRIWLLSSRWMSGYSGLSFFEAALAEFLDIVSAVYLEDADGIIVNLWGILDK